MNSNEIRDYNQGIMEFGAIQCAPKTPNCLHCPLNDSCVALKENRVNELPVKLKKTKVRHRYFNYIVAFDKNNKVVLQQRKGKGIWQNLYQFPLVETDKEFALETLKEETLKVLKIETTSDMYLYNKKPIVHKLSHQHLHTKFWIWHTATDIDNTVSWENVSDYPVPVLIAEFIKTFKI